MSFMILIDKLKFEEEVLTASLFRNQVLTLITSGEIFEVKSWCNSL